MEYEQLGKSPYQVVCMEDCVEYRKICTAYEQLTGDNINIELANAVSNRALILASRWSEIASCAEFVKEKYGFTKTNFWHWAHEHYSNLKAMHTSASIMRFEGKKELEYYLKNSGD